MTTDNQLEPDDVLPPEGGKHASLVPKDAIKGQRADAAGPQIGEWYWVKHEDHNGKKYNTLMVVERVRSNHVVFRRDWGEWSSGEKVRNEDLLRCTKPESNWREIIMGWMADTQKAIQDASKQLLENAVRKNALPSSPEQQAASTSSTGLELSLRVTDPKKQKADLLAIQKQSKQVTEEIAKLSKDYAGLTKCLLSSDLARMHETMRQLTVVEEKIFIIEVYAGLQEEIKQIAEGAPAGVGERIAIRQSLLYMDEETLIDYKKGGLDFENLPDFDKWIARPENLDRCLPEPRGIVAWRVRRSKKDYGHAKNISVALDHMKWESEDFTTYLLIRNGGNVYRIASSVEFAPRLLPLRTEFDGVMQKEGELKDEKGFTRSRKPGEEKPVVSITPADFEYDEKLAELRKNLHHYNRVLVLVQGLLDRSDVFHPHPAINLSKLDQVEEWVTGIRDEEDVILWDGPNWRDYLKKNRETFKKGDYVYCSETDVRKIGWGRQNRRPAILQIKRVRAATEDDREKYVKFNERLDREYGNKSWSPPDVRVPDLGEVGVDVEWNQVEHGYDEQQQWTKVSVDRMGHAWIPANRLINLDTYQSGDFKAFLADRRQKAEYLEWTKYFLRAEDWQEDRRAGLPVPLAHKREESAHYASEEDDL